jgi:hypothetical protein
VLWLEQTLVIAGLDPSIHHSFKKMDARIKSGHDGGVTLLGIN